MKIFGIGLHKTGGTSLSNALNILGYDAIHSQKEMLKMNDNVLDIDTSYIEKHHAFTDTPIHLFYSKLDDLYPGSKFIFTPRDEASWLESTKKHFSHTRAILREKVRGEEMVKYVNELYKSQVFDKKIFLKAYKNYEKSVREYFSERKKDILYYDICGGEGWEKLCSFLEKDIPKENFPHKNKKSNLKNKLLQF